MLTHKTNEIKSSLEPKEQQIESLKINLSDLEKLFDMHTDSLNKMIENVDQKKQTIENLEQDLNRAKRATKQA